MSKIEELEERIEELEDELTEAEADRNRAEEALHDRKQEYYEARKDVQDLRNAVRLYLSVYDQLVALEPSIEHLRRGTELCSDVDEARRQIRTAVEKLAQGS